MTSKQCVGILGGGQLARLLAKAAHELGFEVCALSSSANDPVAYLTYVEWFAPQSWKLFSEKCDYLCFESEFFDPSWAQNILKHNPQIQCKPDIETMLLLRDKLKQKEVFDRLGLRQPHYQLLDPEQALNLQIEILMQDPSFQNGLVLKRSLGGYDGKGNFFVTSRIEAQHRIADIQKFCQQAYTENAQIYAEQMIDFSKELALVCVFSKSHGEFVGYPLMESLQHQGACLEVKGPAIHFGLSNDIAMQASQWGLNITKEFPDLGCFALEFFLDTNNQLWVNEMAPRVHNSGHFTLLEEEQSQFHNHIRSLVGEGIQPFAAQDFYLMRNLLGPENPHRSSHTLHQAAGERVFPKAQFYWYDKTEIRPMRKMGHVNRRLKSLEELLQAQKELRDQEAQFWGLDPLRKDSP